MSEVRGQAVILEHVEDTGQVKAPKRMWVGTYVHPCRHSARHAPADREREREGVRAQGRARSMRQHTRAMVR